LISHCLVSSVFTPGVRILRKGRAYTFGRDQGCDFPLPSEIVSRQHAEIRWIAGKPRGRFAVRDLGSRNGTRVNDVHVTEHIMEDGDTVWIGPFHLQYREYEGDISELLEQASGDFEATLSMPRDALTASPHKGGFSGQFAGDELLEICQLIGLNEKSGVLYVRSPERTGELSFKHGVVVRAECEELRGEPAALKLMTLPEGKFEFIGGAPGQQIVNLSVEGLMMEAARRRDESASSEKS
jgi:pSer/pThr/pTyr-binding forkhead associated (FHA) protein